MRPYNRDADYPYPTPDAVPAPSWRTSAACRGRDWHLWFPQPGTDPTEAKTICATCLVADECLEDALQMRTVDDPIGIRAGIRAHDRAAIRARRRQEKESA